MAFEQVVDLDASVCTAIGGVDRKSNKANPKSAEGYYVGTRQGQSRRLG